MTKYLGVDLAGDDNEKQTSLVKRQRTTDEAMFSLGQFLKTPCGGALCRKEGG